MSTGLPPLRDFFGVWKRCGNSAFWELKKDRPYSRHYIDPVDAAWVSWWKWPDVNGKAFEVKRSLIPQGLSIATVRQEIATLPRHMGQMMDDFVTMIQTLWVLGSSKPDMLQWFARAYHGQDEAYAEGVGKAADFKEPAREEILMGMLQLLQVLGDKLARERTVVLPDELEEKLASYGIIEC